MGACLLDGVQRLRTSNYARGQMRQTRTEFFWIPFAAVQGDGGGGAAGGGTGVQ